MEAELEDVVVCDWTLPNRSARGWVEAELDGAVGLVEKALQSPNSPFPLDDVAADHNRGVMRLAETTISMILTAPYTATVTYVYVLLF